MPTQITTITKKEMQHPETNVTPEEVKLALRCYFSRLTTAEIVDKFVEVMTATNHSVVLNNGE